MSGRLVPARLSLALTVGILVVLLSVLATLQYHWLGQVAEAERARLQAGARTRLEQLALDFDREVTRAYAWLHVSADMLGEDGGLQFARRYEQWAARTEHSGIVAGVYLAEPAEGGARLRRFDAAAREFVPSEWPSALERYRSMVNGEAWPRGGERGGRDGERGRLRVGERPFLDGAQEGAPARVIGGPWGPFVADDFPALVVPIVDPAAFARGARASAGLPPRPRVRGVTAVVLDLDYVRGRLLPALVARHFATAEDGDYSLVVATRREPRTVLFGSDEPDAGRPPDAATTLFDVRFDQLESAAVRGADPGVLAMARRRPPREGPRPPPGDVRGPRGPRGRPDHGLWEASVTHRGGPLEEVVARVRRRNLAISFGILLLLGASAAMIVISSQRARRLADQQVEFVAGVSHELRTPVAVVCAAGENLADGLVLDAAEVRLYGATVRDEGRRLAEMVEQVLEFAGITARERRREREAVRLASVVQEAVKASAVVLAGAGVEVAVDVPPDLPHVIGDAAALRRAVQNLVQNAARHAAAGRWVGISAEAAGTGSRRLVRLTVRDRGPGIAPADRARLFEPFFRGRQALSAGISGSGLGLSLVKRIAESHGGSVEVETALGAGTAFTLVLPAAPARGLATSSAEEGDVQAHPAG